MKFSQFGSSESIPASWILAGLALLILVGLSFSIDEPAAVDAGIPVYAIDEDLAPLESGALDPESPYAELVVPAAYDPQEIRTGVAP